VDAQRKRLALLACILGSTVVGVDGSVITVALPAIREELGGGLAGQQWASNAYLLTLGSLLLIGGSLGDIYGERRIFALGVVGFGVTSLVCAVAPTIEILIAGRALQGASGALLTPAALAVIVSVFERDERSRAIGAWTAWSGIGAALGPLIGGQLVDAASWRWVFALNVPLVALTIALILRAIPAADGGRRKPPDVVGALLCVAGLTGMTFGLIQQPIAGWGATSVLVTLAAGLATFVLFVGYERRARAPVLPLGLFARRNFALGNVQTLVMYAGLALLFFYVVIYLQQVAGYSALRAGLSMLPVTLVMLGLASRFGALADRRGPRAFTAIGPIVAGLGLLLLLRLDRDVSYLSELLPAVGLFALGLSITVAPLTAAVLADATERNAGAASGVNNAIGRVAALIGVAGIGVVIASGFASELDQRLSADALTPAARVAIADAKANPMIQPNLREVPARERPAISEAVSDASLAGFRLGVGTSAAVVILAGVLGAGIRNPRRAVAARECAGGQLVGAPRDAARRPEECAPEPLGGAVAAPAG
jgi:EmrB/QacA subfamily drug resistance transporter